MRFVSPHMSVKVSAASSLLLMAGHADIAAALPGIGSAAGFVGLALGSFAVGRYLGQAGEGATRSSDTEQTYTALLEFDLGGDLHHCNARGQALLGAKAFELEQDGLKNRIHVQDMPEFLTKLSAAGHRDKTGFEPVTASVRILLGEQEASNRHNYTLVTFEFSPLRENRVAAILRLNEAPGQLQKDLQDARSVMKQAQQAKANFLGSVGHELRTPLNAIIGFSDLLNANVQGELTPAQRDYVGHIHQSGAHLLGVVNSLLEMARLDAGHVALEIHAFAPDELVRDVFVMLTPLANENRVALISDFPNALPMLTGDERACRQMLINLVSNAVKFSAKDSQITVRLRRERDTLKIDVNDHGVGIASSALKKVGTPFFQANDGADRTFEGAGLGLSIVRGLVDLHEGSLGITSTLGQGTQVCLKLPLDGPKMGSQESGQESAENLVSVAPESTLQEAQQLRHARG